MTYNGWLCASVVFGEVAAHIFFTHYLPGYD